MNNSLRAQLVWKQLTLRNHLNFHFVKSLHSFMHCVKSVQIRSNFWSVFSCIGLNTGKYIPEITLYLDTFHTVMFIMKYRTIMLKDSLFHFIVAIAFLSFCNEKQFDTLQLPIQQTHTKYKKNQITVSETFNIFKTKHYFYTYL